MLLSLTGASGVGDARWPVALIDTDALTPAQVAERVETWARAALAGDAPAVTLR